MKNTSTEDELVDKKTEQSENKDKKTSKHKKWIVIAVVLIIALIATMIAGFISGGNKVTQVKHTETMRVASGSMEPTIKTGALVRVENVNANDLEVGDILVFNNTNLNIPVMHRIVKIEENNGELEFTTKGDNNAAQDKLRIHEENIIGKVVKINNSVAKITSFLMNGERVDRFTATLTLIAVLGIVSVAINIFVFLKNCMIARKVLKQTNYSLDEAYRVIGKRSKYSNLYGSLTASMKIGNSNLEKVIKVANFKGLQDKADETMEKLKKEN